VYVRFVRVYWCISVCVGVLVFVQVHTHQFVIYMLIYICMSLDVFVYV